MLEKRKRKETKIELRPDLAITFYYIFKSCELLNTHWAAGVEAAGGDADLCTHAKLAAIGKLG